MAFIAVAIGSVHRYMSIRRVHPVCWQVMLVIVSVRLRVELPWVVAVFQLVGRG